MFTIDDWLPKFSNGRASSIYIDGLISSGKSTLCEMLAANAGVHFQPETGHEGAILGCYLADQEELSASFQVHMLRACVVREDMERFRSELVPPTHNLTMVDRSITGNGVFGVTNHLFKIGISPKQFDLYKKIFEVDSARCKGVPFGHGDLNVYLHVTADTAIARCMRRWRSTEAASYDKKYFQDLERVAMLATLANLSLPAPHHQLVLDWNQDQDDDPTPDFHRIMTKYVNSDAFASSIPPTSVTLSKKTSWKSVMEHHPSSPSSSSSSSCSAGEDEEEEEDEKEVDALDAGYTTVLDFSFLESEEAFFSYSNVLAMYNALCVKDRHAKFVPVNALFIVPKCLTATPMGGLFTLSIQE